MIMDVEKADWIIVDFIMMIVQVDLVVVMKEDMEVGVAEEAEEIVLERCLESC